MLFKKFSIEYYRGFETEQNLLFGIPDGNIGSGITYIVGENNTGKTTLLEALCLNKSDTIRSSERQTTPPKFTLYDTTGGFIRVVDLIRNESLRLKESHALDENNSFEIITARRHWQANINSRVEMSPIQAVNSSLTQKTRNNNPTLYIAEVLKKIEEETTTYDSFIELIKKVIPEFTSFTVGNESNEYIEYTTKNAKKHTSDFLGDGIISIIRILLHLFADTKRLLIIDEPELSLHPLAQKRLLKVIADYAKDRQIIICTHSPYLVSWDYIKNGAKVNKVTKYEDKKSEIHTLKTYDTYETLLNGANWQQPFLMDIVAKEIFFHDSFLFVEGQEDVGLLKQIGDLKDDINLFGYGVRGKDAFKFALQLAKDLGIKKAGVILDAGEAEQIIKEDLEGSFPNYKIIQWNKEDIRDKPLQTPRPAKVGYFTNGGVKKQALELDDYPEKVKILNDYF